MNFLLDTRMCRLCLTLQLTWPLRPLPLVTLWLNSPKSWIHTLFPGSLFKSFPYRQR